MTTEVFTPEEVAERLRLSVKTVKDMLRAGRLKGFKIGKLWRIRPQDLAEFIDSQGK